MRSEDSCQGLRDLSCLPESVPDTYGRKEYGNGLPDSRGNRRRQPDRRRRRISTAVCGVLIIGVLTNGMTILNISEYYQLIIRGCIFLGAVCLDGIQKQLAGRKKVKKVA